MDPLQHFRSPQVLFKNTLGEGLNEDGMVASVSNEVKKNQKEMERDRSEAESSL